MDICDVVMSLVVYVYCVCYVFIDLVYWGVVCCVCGGVYGVVFDGMVYCIWFF